MEGELTKCKLDTRLSLAVDRRYTHGRRDGHCCLQLRVLEKV